LLPTYLPDGMVLHDRQRPADDGEGAGGETVTRLIYVRGAGCSGGKEFKVSVREPHTPPPDEDRNKPRTVWLASQECSSDGTSIGATVIDWTDGDGRDIRVYGVGPSKEVERFADALRSVSREEWERETAATDPEPPPCQPSDLAMADRTANGATQHWIVGYEIRNVSPGSCLASGTPRLELFEAHGLPLLVVQRSSAMMMRGKRPAEPIRLAPGARGFVGVAGDHCDVEQPAATEAHFTMPGFIQPIVVVTTVETCAHGLVGVSPIRADAADIYD
jgi:hypothetical protein